MCFKIAYDIVGSGESIIFTHGIGSRKITWKDVIEVLKDKYQCISYDLRGHGSTPLPDGNDFNLDDFIKTEGWVTIKANSPYIEGYYFNLNSSGLVSGDHFF